MSSNHFQSVYVLLMIPGGKMGLVLLGSHASFLEKVGGRCFQTTAVEREEKFMEKKMC